MGRGRKGKGREGRGREGREEQVRRRGIEREREGVGHVHREHKTKSAEEGRHERCLIITKQTHLGKSGKGAA